MKNSVEQWLPVVFKDQSYPGYEVSDCGRIRKSATGAILGSHSQRYASVTLNKDGKSYTVYIHLLVAEAFLGRRPAGTHVCWRDGNRRNIAAENLYYSSGTSLDARRVQLDLGQSAGNLRHFAASSAFEPWPQEISSSPQLRLIDFTEDAAPVVTLVPHYSGDEIPMPMIPQNTGQGVLLPYDMLESLGITDTAEVIFRSDGILVTPPSMTLPPGSRLHFSHGRS